MPGSRLQEANFFLLTFNGGTQVSDGSATFPLRDVEEAGRDRANLSEPEQLVELFQASWFLELVVEGLEVDEQLVRIGRQHARCHLVKEAYVSEEL